VKEFGKSFIERLIKCFCATFVWK